MDGWGYSDVGCEPWAAVSGAVAAKEAAVRFNAARLAELRRHALTVVLRSWESPAGENFTSYLEERCRELAGTVDLLESSADQLRECGRLVRDAEALQRQAGG
ncbi:hypothetical protein AC792_11630 [Arthrobacter sp. RIT-PI-e]|uniref:hypothetical protein n=1 Tax=Arthrobacter sp. RIT-PI-e TaxID=1681197 RepID=UPI000675F27F|nr:hypothetical protein [Arthrobacter sp. RIT-PI-e]KNC18511.1 hypothetical protein AC792_11630 [Arthrobacter sp. RIT-PI-e]